ncbi:MAG: hypothetical protein IPI35_34485 [Deltaproteobacteria bacterium]|nr:hypothetical protein [Deltaproteobacteria bacterium]
MLRSPMVVTQAETRPPSQAPDGVIPQERSRVASPTRWLAVQNAPTLGSAGKMTWGGSNAA